VHGLAVAGVVLLARQSSVTAGDVRRGDAWRKATWWPRHFTWVPVSRKIATFADVPFLDFRNVVFANNSPDKRGYFTCVFITYQSYNLSFRALVV
jgi:hypothetical protein